jgi:predicted ester cyclase
MIINECYHDLLFNSCHLRHRQDIELERAGHGPFEMMGLMSDGGSPSSGALRGRDAVREFAAKFRATFPDLNFWGTADLIAEGDYVVGQWEGGGTHTGGPFDDMPVGSLPENTGRAMRFTGTTVLKVENGLITEEIGLDDGVTALRQLGLIRQA